MNQVLPVVLCGGSGTRLWPLSSSSFPKQFLVLSGDDSQKSLFQQAIERIHSIANEKIKLGSTVIVTNEEHRFLICNPTFYKDKEIDYDMSNIVKTSITKDENLIKVRMSHSNKETIKACLENIVININTSQKNIADPLVKSKKNDTRFSVDLLYTNMILSNATEIKQFMDQINKIKTDLSSVQTKQAEKVLPINIEKKSFPSLKLGALLGLFLGLCLGFFISLIKQIKM
jgi:23S rRNA A1618 N6-methylase RlmF